MLQCDSRVLLIVRITRTRVDLVFLVIRVITVLILLEMFSRIIRVNSFNGVKIKVQVFVFQRNSVGGSRIFSTNKRLSRTGPLFKIIEMFSTCVGRLRAVASWAGVASVRTRRRAVSVGRVGAVAGVIRVVGAGLRVGRGRGHVGRGVGRGRRARARLLTCVHVPCNVPCQRHIFRFKMLVRVPRGSLINLTVFVNCLLTWWAGWLAVLGHVPAVPASGAAGRTWPWKVACIGNLFSGQVNTKLIFEKKY